jgi:hypothetical protein
MRQHDAQPSSLIFVSSEYLLGVPFAWILSSFQDLYIHVGYLYGTALVPEFHDGLPVSTLTDLYVGVASLPAFLTHPDIQFSRQRRLLRAWNHVWRSPSRFGQKHRTYARHGHQSRAPAGHLEETAVIRRRCSWNSTV